MTASKTKAIFIIFLFIAPMIFSGCAKSGCPANEALYNEFRGVTKKEAKQEKRKTNSLGMKAPTKAAAKNQKQGKSRDKSLKYNQKQNTKKRRY